MEDILISVIIPCYNVPEKFINRAVKSICSNDFNGYEVLLIDDGSQTEFRLILEEIREKYDNVKVYFYENAGVSVARNRGSVLAKGRYIAFVDADDIVTSWFLKDAWRVANETDADLVIGGVAVTNSIEKRTPAIKYTKLRYEVFQNENVKQLKPFFISKDWKISFSNCYIGRGPVARLIRKNIMLENPFMANLKIGEDQVWNLQLLTKCSCICITYEQWYWYWMNPESATHKKNVNIDSIWEKHLIEIGKYIDLKDESDFDSYTELVYEGIYQIWDCYLKYFNFKDFAKRRKIKKNLYKQEPWVYLGNRDFIRRANIKYKLIGLLYKGRLLWLFLSIRKIIENILKAGK